MGWKKENPHIRVNLYFDAETHRQLDWLVKQTIEGSRSRVVRELVQEAAERAIRAGTRKKRRLAVR